MTVPATASEALEGFDLSGATALVTGASTGLGWETARALAAAGARVIVTARDEAKVAATIATLAEAVPSAAIEGGVLELGSLDSVRRFADWVISRTDALQLQVNNAGIMAVPYSLSTDGFESQFATNHLGHFLLTGRLVGLLRAGAPSRVVNLSSGGHATGGIRLEDPNFLTGDYEPWVAYGQSKTANILFSAELDRRLAPQVHSYSVHPGRVGTELGRYLTRETVGALLQRAGGGGGLPPVKSVPEGAATSAWACVAPELVDHGGAYLADCALATAAAHALDADVARRLWELSEQLVGEPFPTS